MVSFPSFFFISPYSSGEAQGSEVGKEECSEGLKASDLQVGELRGYKRSRSYPLCLYSVGCPFSFYLISNVTELYDYSAEDKTDVHDRLDSGYTRIMLYFCRNAAVTKNAQ